MVTFLNNLSNLDLAYPGSLLETAGHTAPFKLMNDIGKYEDTIGKR